MKKNILKLALTGSMCLMVLIGCGAKETKEPGEYTLTTLYTIDGVETAELPDGQFYDYVSITGGEDVNASWDATTWTITADELALEDATCTVDFTYTKSPFKMNHIGYLTLQAAMDAASTTRQETIDCTADYSGYGITPVDTDIILNLNGHTIDGAGNDTITNQSTLSINGDGHLINTVAGEYSKSIVNYGTLTLTDLTLTNSTDNVTIWNSNNEYSVLNFYNCDVTHEVAASNVIINSGTINIYSGVYHAVSDEGYSVIKENYETATINYYDGSITNSGSGYSVTLLEGTLSNYSTHDIENGNNLGDSATAGSANPVSDETNDTTISGTEE